MTISEALRKTKGYLTDIIPSNDYDEVEEIVKALEQEPCEDAISREHALTEFKRLYFDNDTVIRCAELVLRGEPSVYPKPKTGHWIKYGIPRCEEQHYQCTNCDYYINFGKWGELYTKEFKYCPNCGAKMVESQECEK